MEYSILDKIANIKNEQGESLLQELIEQKKKENRAEKEIVQKILRDILTKEEKEMIYKIIKEKRY